MTNIIGLDINRALDEAEHERKLSQRFLLGAMVWFVFVAAAVSFTLDVRSSAALNNHQPGGAGEELQCAEGGSSTGTPVFSKQTSAGGGQLDFTQHHN